MARDVNNQKRKDYYIKIRVIAFIINFRRNDSICNTDVNLKMRLRYLCCLLYSAVDQGDKKVQVGKDQQKAQSEKDSHSKNRGGKKPN